MMLVKRIGYAMAVIAAAAWLAACSGNAVKSDLGINDAPDWVNQGSQALDNRDGRLIHGIGSAPAMNDLSLQTSTADERARAEVARVLSSFMHVASQDYAASAGAGQDRQNQASVAREIDNITRQNVSGARIIAHWRNPETQTIWSLAELDMRNVKNMVAESRAMNAGFKGYFAAHADNLFDSLAGDGVR